MRIDEKTKPEPGPNDEATAAWNGVLFDKFCRFKNVLVTGFASHSDAALAHHPPPHGGRVLDVGCGFGDVTTALAASVGAGGTVVGVDVAARFVASAGDAARQAGAGNARFLRADVQTDDLGGPYDLAFSRFGTMFFASPVAALRNVARSLAPGGRLCAIVWRRREDNPWVHVAETVVRGLVPERHDSGEPTCGPGRSPRPLPRRTRRRHALEHVDRRRDAAVEPAAGHNRHPARRSGAFARGVARPAW